MKLLGSTKNKITEDKNGENVPYLEITEVVLVHCNIVNNGYQQDSRVLYTFVPTKWFGQLLDISRKIFIFLKSLDSESSYIEVWFIDQNSKHLDIDDKINITLVINQSVNIKIMRYLVHLRDQIFVKVYGFLSFAKTTGKNIGEKVIGNSVRVC